MACRSSACRTVIALACGLLGWEGAAMALAAEQESAVALSATALTAGERSVRYTAEDAAQPDRLAPRFAELLPANRGVGVKIELDAQTGWNALTVLLRAAHSRAIANVELVSKDQRWGLDLPGAPPTGEQVVDLSLGSDSKQGLVTEVEGKKWKVTDELLRGLVEQMPEATICVHVEQGVSGMAVLEVLRTLKEKLKARATSFLPAEVFRAKTEDRSGSSPGERAHKKNGVTGIVHAVGD